MKEYVALFFLVFLVVTILPFVVVSLAPPFEGNTVMEAKYYKKEEAKYREVFTLWSDKSFLDISRMDSKLREDLRLPDLYIIITEERDIVKVKLWGKWDRSAYSNVDRVELYYVKPEEIEKKLNLTIVIHPTYEADIYGNETFLKSIPDILRKARDFEIKARTLRDLLDKENREKLLKGIFGEYKEIFDERILRREWAISWKLVGSTWTEKDVDRGKLYTINGNFSLTVSKDPPVIVWKGEEVGYVRDGDLEINLMELEMAEKYPYLFLSASFRGDLITLYGNKPGLGYIDSTRREYLGNVSDCYYRYFLGGGYPLIRSYTNMIPGLFVQKWMLGYANPFDPNSITLDERRTHPITLDKEKSIDVESYINSIVRGGRPEELTVKPKELADRMFWSVVASWIVNSLFISALLTIAVWIFRRAW